MRSSRYRSLAAGIGKRMSSVTSVTMDGVTYAVADLAKLFNNVADALDAAAPLRAAWISSARSAHASEQRAHPVMVAFVKWVRGTFGKKDAAAMADFGLDAPAAHPAKAETKANAQVKAKATRAARHTAGTPPTKS